MNAVEQSAGPSFVSIVIASYGRADLVARAVRSVLAQTHSNLEVIVSDDASPDNTLGVLAAIDDPRLRIHAQPTNVGCWENWATAVRMTKGEYLVFLGDDDSLSPNFVSCHLETFLRFPAVDAVFCPLEDFRLDGTLVFKMTPSFEGGEVGRADIVRGLISGKSLFFGAAMFKRAFAAKVWEETRAEDIVADWGLILRGCLFHDMRATSCTGCLYLKTVHPIRLSSRWTEVTRRLAELCERMARLCDREERSLARALTMEAAELRVTLGRHHAALGEMQSSRRQFWHSFGLVPWRLLIWSQLIQSYFCPSRMVRTSREQRGLA